MSVRCLRDRVTTVGAEADPMGVFTVEIPRGTGAVLVWAASRGSRSFPLRFRVPPRATLDVGEVVLPLRGPATVRLVWDPDARAVAEATVRWRWLGLGYDQTLQQGGAPLEDGSVRTDGDGRFALTGLPPGATLQLAVEVPSASIRLPVEANFVVPPAGDDREREVRVRHPEEYRLRILPAGAVASPGFAIQTKLWGGGWKEVVPVPRPLADGTLVLNGAAGWPLFARVRADGYLPTTIGLSPGESTARLQRGSSRMEVILPGARSGDRVGIGLIGNLGGLGSTREVLPALTWRRLDAARVEIDLVELGAGSLSFSMSPFSRRKPASLLVVADGLSEAWVTRPLAREDLETGRIEARLTPSGWLHVTCVDAAGTPVVGAEVALLRGDLHTSFQGVGGEFLCPTFSGLVPVDAPLLLVMTDPLGAARLPYIAGLGWRVRVAQGDKIPEDLRIGADVRGDQTLRVVLKPASVLDVRWRGEGGHGARIVVHDEWGDESGVRSNVSGSHVTFRDLSPGRYLVGWRDAIGAAVPPRRFTGALAHHAMESIELGVGGSEIELEVPEGMGTLAVRSSGALAAALRGIELLPIELAEMDPPADAMWQRTAGSATFTALPVGTYVVRILLPSTDDAGQGVAYSEVVRVEAERRTDVVVGAEGWTELTVTYPRTGVVVCRGRVGRSPHRPVSVSDGTSHFLLPYGDYDVMVRGDGEEGLKRSVRLDAPKRHVHLE